MGKEEIRDRLTACGIPCSGGLAEKLRVYGDLLVEWNTRMDLTAVTDEAETIDRHFADSLMPLTVPGLIGKPGKLIDVGTGAGFPGMPLALALPDWQVVLLDAQQKRLNFLQAVKDSLHADNVTLVHARAEDAARMKEFRGSFDLVTARAVAPLNVLAEYLLPFAVKGGMALCWKGPSVSGEMPAGKRASVLLGGEILPPVPVTIPGRDWQHTLVPIRKTGITPGQYPRKAGMPARSPLGEPAAKG